jgi:hypothetical protein
MLFFDEGFEEDQVMRNWRSVERNVSTFLKNTKYPECYQIAFFTFSASPQGGADKLRNDLKTMGANDIVYGRAGTSFANETVHPGLGEVRFGGHNEGVIRRMAAGEFAQKIFTLAPGFEAVPTVPVQQVNHLGGWTNNQFALTFEQALQSARLRTILDLADLLPLEQRPLRINILTDFDALGADYARKHRATPIGPPPKDPATVANLFAVWKKYKMIKDEKKDELVNLFNDAKGDQEKMIFLGKKSLQAIGDWPLLPEAKRFGLELK